MDRDKRAFFVILGVLAVIFTASLIVSAFNHKVRIAELKSQLAIETAKVARDDILLNLFLEHPWVREKKVHHRWYLISNGETVHAFTQYPDPDKTYQLSY